jgi:hypothetical protein
LRDIERFLALQQSLQPAAWNSCLRDVLSEGRPDPEGGVVLGELLRSLAEMGPDHLEAIRELRGEELQKGLCGLPCGPLPID